MIDLTGKKFGRWTAIKIAGKRPNGDGGTRIFWECRCECGNIRNIDGASLKSGHSKSCGCLRKEGRRIFPHGIPEQKYLLRMYKRNAEARGLDFLLTKEQFASLIERDCYYCGIKPGTLVKAKGYSGKYAYNGVDRVDNSVGYIYSNCVPCCETCNRAKRMMSEDEFAEWIVRAYRHFAANKKFWSGIYFEFQGDGTAEWWSKELEGRGIAK